MGSSSVDHPLAESARAMILAAEQSRSVVEVLAETCPHIYSQIQKVRDCQPLLQLWGRSRNIDANANEVIVHPAILQAIGEVAGVSMRGNVVHAGLEHTYGYLFSLIETPYGFKRDRWTKPDMECGLGIEELTLRDNPTEGTLWTNLTWFAGQIAFHDRKKERNILAAHSEWVSSVAREFDYADLNGIRIIDEVSASTNGKARCIRFLTDLIEYPHPPKDGDTHLLIYSIVGGTRSLAKLITMFSISPKVVAELTSPDQLGQQELEQLPYNAYVRGLHEGPLRVNRVVEPGSTTSTAKQ